jgi:S-adenosylmethionine decarboxylase
MHPSQTETKLDGFAGWHLIVDVLDGRGLDCEDRVRTALTDCVDACGATLLHLHVHKFSPAGLSGVAVLAESHITVHTWPEEGYGAFDIFMCGAAQPRAAIEVLSNAFETQNIRVRELIRGEGITVKTPALLT